MGRECNLDLCLLPAGVEATRPSPDTVESRSEESTGNSKKLTIFYNGRVSSCNVTELQATAILRLAKREMDEKTKTTNGEEYLLPSQLPQAPTTARKTTNGEESLSQSQPQASTTTAISMKRSLQRFLEKRMNRIHSTSPYSH